MTYSVYQHWDPLKVCVVGQSYTPEFYSFIKSKRLRTLFEKIALETEEDYQNIIKTLQKFNVEIIRPNVPQFLIEDYLTTNSRIPGPVSMNPRDQMIMIGERFFAFPFNKISVKVSGRNIVNTGTQWTSDLYNTIKGSDWPDEFTNYKNLPLSVQQEIARLFPDINIKGDNIKELTANTEKINWWDPVLQNVKSQNNEIITNFQDSNLDLIPSNGITRIGKDLYFGCSSKLDTDLLSKKIGEKYFPDYRCHFITTGGHIDGCFTPVVPGLIVSIEDIKTYEKTFPGWEVVYLKGESWTKVEPFLELKKKNGGKWWIKDYERDDELINYVETWLQDWVGYAEESVFDVNILVINEKNVIVNGYNEQAFRAFDRYGITAHICPVRHRYFWDGGVHCITLDLNRQGSMQNYFPERN